MSTPFDLRSVRSAFRGVTVAAVPAAAAFDADRWARAEAIVADAVGARPPSVQRQLRLFFRVLGALSWLRFGRAFGSLGPDRTLRLLQSLERAPLLLLRRGTWGVRTLAFMGVYGQDGVRTEVGYRAVAEGWSRRGGGVPWPDRAGRGVPEDSILTALRPEP